MTESAKNNQTAEDRKAKLEELRNLCRAKRGEMRINRSTKLQKENILDKTLKQIGIDKEKFKKDLEAVKKQGGLELNIKN